MDQASRPRIVLASGSPRRRQIAVEAGWDVLVIPPPDDVERMAPPRSVAETLEQYVLRMARVKGEAVAARGFSDAILACDTLSEVDGLPLGKPVDRDDARRMLSLLSGRIHRVLSGVWLRPPTSHGPTSSPLEAVEESVLRMEPLTDEFLHWYLESGMWRDKAGACGFQDERLPLHLVAGSATNVVGLPLERIHRMLAAIGEDAPARPGTLFDPQGRA